MFQIDHFLDYLLMGAVGNSENKVKTVRISAYGDGHVKNGTTEKEKHHNNLTE